MLIKIRRAWEAPERDATPRNVWLGRRRILQAMGFAGLGAALAPLACKPGAGLAGAAPIAPIDVPPAPEDVRARFPGTRNEAYALDRPVTPRRIAATYNNFYEFTTDKAGVWEKVGRFTVRPWTIEVAGLCAKPKTWDVDDLVRAFALEERLYRFRCVEAWSMAVPWNGFPMATLLKAAEPRPEARFVRFVSFDRPSEAPGQRFQPWYSWPYYEGLTIQEAMNELAFFAVGVYGEPLLKQHGAPFRAVVPWKYGYKSAKSIVRIELVAERPRTFWNDLAPDEYDFFSNVNPAVPHPRWSQASERDIATDERRPTKPFNGYEAQVGGLYKS